jgi:HEAT repeat protein
VVLSTLALSYTDEAMDKPTQRSAAELVGAYRDYLLSNVSKVHILGETDERELLDVFVELTVVDQRAPQQHAEFLGMVDSAMRQRLNPFADVNRESPPGATGRRSVRPDELLRPGTKGIVTGAPGSGKTTLLKYLALRAHERERRLALWLELKAVDKSLFAQAERAAAHDGSLILPEIWLKHLKSWLLLTDGETKLLRAYWQERFKAGEVAVFLDGFDELQDEAIERSLNKCVREFASASRDNTLLISTRPYAHHRLGKERLQEFEIEPLSQRQIEAFLNCYYPNNAATKSLLKTLRERSSLRELLHVPLLLGIILRLYREGRFADERLELYETIVADLVSELDRSKSINRLFKIDDERLRVDFLEFLSFERLLRDPLGEEEREANRIIFSYDLLREKARIFLTQERMPHSPRDLADDALATPLLREVGADTFAFTHLTLQEYLAARAFAAFYKVNRFEGQKIFCRVYHNPIIVEMEVLPMTLGAVENADSLYAEIERWPESLNFTNLRLRARGLAYSTNLKHERLSKLIDRLLELALRKNPDEEPYLEAIVASFAGVSRQTLAFMESRANLSLRNPNFFEMALVLGQLGSDKAVDALISVLNHEHPAIRQNSAIRTAVIAILNLIGSDRATDTFISALNDENGEVRLSALKGLRQIGSDRAVEALVGALKHEDSKVRHAAIVELSQAGYDDVVDVLVPVLDDEDKEVRGGAAVMLHAISSDKSVGALVSAFNSGHPDRATFALYLGLNGSEAAVDSLISALKGPDISVHAMASLVLGLTRSHKAVEPVIFALTNKDPDVRMCAAGALGYLHFDEAVDALASALSDENEKVRSNAVTSLGKIGSDRARAALVGALNHWDGEVRQKAGEALQQLDSGKIVNALVNSLNEDGDADSNVASALQQFPTDKAVDALIAALEYEDTSECRGVLMILGFIGSDKAVEALVSALKHQDNDMRLTAAAVLRAINPDRAVRVLTAALSDSDEDMRRNAVESLGVINSDGAVDTLISALNHEDGVVRRHAAEALAKVSSAALISGLERTVSRRDTFACQKAVTAIGYHSSDRRTLDQLRQLSLKHKEGVVREAAREAADKLARKLELLGQVVHEGAAHPLSDNESREGVLVGEVTKTIFEAGHIFRPTPNSDWGVDGEIEFKNERGEASGRRVYLQLKSGDSYLRTRKSDGKEIFTIKNPRHAEYWQSQPCPVLLVIRDSAGRIRWMNVSEYLQRYGASVRHIEFQGEPFTTESVKQMRVRFGR